MGQLRRTLRAFPTLLRIGVAETVAYRAEFLIWILTTTLPLVMLALWTTVASEGPFRGLTSADYVTYFLAILIVRNLTGSWVAWQISEEIREGTMAMRLLRPIHPFVAFAATHISAIPLRGLVALPVAVVLLIMTGGGALTHSPLQLAAVLPSIAIAWMISFTVLFAIGSLAFFITRAMALNDAYFALYVLLSGYLMPLQQLPRWLAPIAAYSPFRSMLSVPVELLTHTLDARAVGLLLAGQLGWLVVAITAALWVWRAGVRRFEAVGG